MNEHYQFLNQGSQAMAEATAERTYVLDAESGAETARLLDQDGFMTEGMGGLLAEQEDLSETVDVLDIGCGPGGWVQQLAMAHPEMEVTGIDRSNSMITYARAQVQLRSLENVDFRVMNALQPLDFPAESFDLINARMISTFMLPDAWTPLFSECRRLLRPGGVLRLTETDWFGHTTSPAGMQLTALVLKAMHNAKRNYGNEYWNGTISPFLLRHFHEAGFRQVQNKMHVIDYSMHTLAHARFHHDWLMTTKLIEPFLKKMEVANQEELDQLRTQFLDDMFNEDFCAFFYYFTLWSRKD